MLSEGGRKLELMTSDIQDWKITFVDTGLTSNIGQRLKAVEPYCATSREFLANYSDGLTNLPLPAQLEHFRRQDAIASFVSVKPHLSYHVVSADPSGPRDRRSTTIGSDAAPHQRRLLRPPARDFRLHARRRGAGVRAVPAPGERRGV